MGLVELCAFNQFEVIHGSPGMLWLIDSHILAAPFDQIPGELVRLYPGINAVFTLVGLLALVKPGNLYGVIGNVDVTIFVAVIDATITAMNL